MAKAPKAEPETGADDWASSDPQDAVAGTTAKQLNTTLRTLNELDAKQDKINGDRAAAFKRFEESGGNKQALKDAMAVMNMEMGHARDRVRAREAYLRELGWYNQLDMFEKQDLGVPDSKLTVAPTGKETSEKPKAAEPKNGGPKSIGSQQADSFLSAAH